jgi:hypothetical protein
MSTGEARSHVFNGQQYRQPGQPDDEPVHGFLPVTSSGTFLLPGTQNDFTFSAEPGLIDYGSMASLPLSTGTGHESGFTPNTSSSFDSSLHPDFVNTSYPPLNTYMQTHQIKGLSPAPYSRNGQSISPSHSVDHLSPDASYLSDPSYQDFSNYTTPSFQAQYTEEPFANHNFADHNIATNAFDTFPQPLEMSLPMTSDVLAAYNAQPPHTHATNIRSDSYAQLITPCSTNDSSPIISDEASNFANLAGVQDKDTGCRTPPNVSSYTMQSTLSKRQQQNSPALTNSPGDGRKMANPRPRAHHLTSPIVRVENYSPGRSPSPSDISRPVSKRSHGSRLSPNHLSPFPVDDSSDDSDVQSDNVRVMPAVRHAERKEDGSWVPATGSGQTGLSPDDRQAMDGAWVPSLDELVEHRRKQEKTLEVEQWLTRSEVGSEAGDGRSSTKLLAPVITGRRRARSTNDAHRQGYGMKSSFGVHADWLRLDDSGIPGPGVYIDERSEYDEYEDDDDDDNDDDYDPEPDSPAAEIDIQASHADTSPFPPVVEYGSVLGAVIRPWIDTPRQAPSPSNHLVRWQPPTSNAAMMRFRLRAKEVETASLAATLGSRRLSESDLGSVRADPGVVKVIEPDPKRQRGQRRPSFLESILPKRTNSNNVLKRKGSIPAQQQQLTEAGTEKSKEIVVVERPKRMGSWGRPKSPRLDTSIATLGKDIGTPSSTNLSATSGPWYQGAKEAVLKRTRSRSDLGKSTGLAELMVRHGGPPMPTLPVSPLAETEIAKISPHPSPGGDDDDDDEEGQEPVSMDLTVRSDPIIPTHEGFKTHARQLNPRLVDYMVERITQEQVRRYKRLLEFRVKHLNAVKSANCASAKFCPDLGGESKQLKPRAGNKESDAPFIGFQITAPDSSEGDGEPPPEGTVVSAQFPPGVPLPPVKRLPAEFECPLCFKVKKFYKPSDWTKHVHEDVQPFTCTFPNCGEPKSFKRKADWVRHENERHRQLENWTCQMPDCNHTCYRKDNFVQHLVREHKIAEPRVRTGRGANKDAPVASETGMQQQPFLSRLANNRSDNIWNIVERCRRDTTKQPKDEPCRFCGNICNSWKKLTVHLAKHMEQISMPILPLVEQKQMNADTIISPVVEMPELRKFSATPSKSPFDNPSRYNPNNNSTAALGLNPYGQYPQDPSSAISTSNVMHTYPPPQMMNFKNPQATQNAAHDNYSSDLAHNYVGQTYPGLQDPARAQGSYVNGLHLPGQPYMNGTMPHRYPVTPVSAIAQQPQPSFVPPAVETTGFSADTLEATYFTQEPQTIQDVGYNAGILGYDSSAYQDIPYMPTQQHNYPYRDR